MLNRLFKAWCSCHVYFVSSLRLFRFVFTALPNNDFIPILVLPPWRCIYLDCAKPRSSHIPGKTTEPKQVPPETAAQVAALRNQSAVLSDRADQAAVQIGSKVHEGGQALGSQLPDSLAKPAEPVAEWEKGDIRKTAESGWEQVTIAAKGAADAAARVGSAVSENAHRAIENKYGKQVDQVAQGEQSQIGSSLPGVEDNGVWRGGRTPSLTDAPDVGDTGANLASTAGAAVKGTSVVVQGSNAATGAAAAKST